MLRAAVWRLLHPRRTIKPTRDGWWCLLVAVGLGVAAINTGNNLLYLLVSALLALIVVSGILSEQAMRGVRLTGIGPEELYAGRAVVLGATLANRKRWLTSYSITLELLAPDAVRSSPARASSTSGGSRPAPTGSRPGRTRRHAGAGGASPGCASPPASRSACS